MTLKGKVLLIKRDYTTPSGIPVHLTVTLDLDSVPPVLRPYAEKLARRLRRVRKPP